MKTKIVTIRFREVTEYVRDFEVNEDSSQDQIRMEFESLPGDEQKRVADVVNGSWEITEITG